VRPRHPLPLGRRRVEQLARLGLGEGRRASLVAVDRRAAQRRRRIKAKYRGTLLDFAIYHPGKPVGSPRSFSFYNSIFLRKSWRQSIVGAIFSSKHNRVRTPIQDFSPKRHWRITTDRHPAVRGRPHRPAPRQQLRAAGRPPARAPAAVQAAAARLRPSTACADRLRVRPSAARRRPIFAAPAPPQQLSITVSHSSGAARAPAAARRRDAMLWSAVPIVVRAGQARVIWAAIQAQPAAHQAVRVRVPVLVRVLARFLYSTMWFS
jgi:hypothetical protein